MSNAQLDVGMYPSVRGNFFQSPELCGAFNKIGLKTLSLSFQGKGARGFLLAHSYDRVPLYSTLFPRFEVFYGPAVGEDLDILNDVLERLCKLAKNHQAVSLFIRTPFPFPYASEIFEDNGFERHLGGGEFSAIIDLEKNQDDLWKDMKRFARRCVKGALQKNVEVRSVETEQDLLQFYELYVRTGNRRGFYPYPYGLFDYLWRQLEPRGIIKYFVAYWEGKPIGGIVNTFYQGESIPWFACSLDEFWRLHPNHLLFWHSICWSQEVARSSKFKLYHLPSQKEAKQGIDYHTFKTCFGGNVIEECTFYTIILASVRCRALGLLNRLPKASIQRILLSISESRRI